MRLESRDCKWPTPTGVSVTHTPHLPSTFHFTVVVAAVTVVIVVIVVVTDMTISSCRHRLMPSSPAPCSTCRGIPQGGRLSPVGLEIHVRRSAMQPGDLQCPALSSSLASFLSIGMSKPKFIIVSTCSFCVSQVKECSNVLIN